MKKLKVIDKDFGILNWNGIPVVSSRTVREVFNKEHRHVLRDIRELVEKVRQSDERTGYLGLSRFGQSYFIESTYTNKQNKEQPEYLLDEDGFTLLVMGYTEDGAIDFKLAYIRQFREMKRYIANLNVARVEYPELTFAIKVANARPAPYHFTNEADLVNYIVLGMSAKQFKELHSIGNVSSIRPYLTADQLYYIGALQKVCIGLVWSEKNYYKRKHKLEEYYLRLKEDRERKQLLLVSKN